MFRSPKLGGLFGHTFAPPPLSAPPPKIMIDSHVLRFRKIYTFSAAPSLIGTVMEYVYIFLSLLKKIKYVPTCIHMMNMMMMGDDSLSIDWWRLSIALITGAGVENEGGLFLFFTAVWLTCTPL
jgi:hypothetical protein